MVDLHLLIHEQVFAYRNAQWALLIPLPTPIQTPEALRVFDRIHDDDKVLVAYCSPTTRPSGVVARMLFLSESKKQRFHKKIPLYLHP